VTNILKALQLFLESDFELASKYMELASRPNEFFRALKDQDSIFEKLQMTLLIEKKASPIGSVKSSPVGSDSEGEPAKPAVTGVSGLFDALWTILDLGFPKLIFTILDAPELRERIVKHKVGHRFLEAATYLSLREYGTLIELLEGSGVWFDEDDHENFSYDFERIRLLGEGYFQSRQYGKATEALSQAAQPDIIERYPHILMRLGHCHLLNKQWDVANEYFLQSLRKETTAEAWVGIAFASYRSERFDLAYEALREALWLDRGRCDVWAFLTLLHIRNRNDTLLDICFRETLSLAGQEGDELLLEIAVELLKSTNAEVAVHAENAAKTALKIRETGQGHEVLADCYAMQGLYEKASLTAGQAVRLLYDKPRHRDRIVSKATYWAELVNDPPLAEAVHISEKLASLKYEQEEAEKSHLAKSLCSST